MKKMRLLWIAVVLLVCGTAIVACKSKKVEVKPVKGILEEPIGQLQAPDVVEATMNRHVLDDNFENILMDTVTKVGVWSLVRCGEEQSSEGFGLVVVNGGYATAFPAIRHGNNPRTQYDTATGNLWFTGGVMEGTGVLVERPYLLRFREKGNAFIAATIDPYDMQEALCKELTYSVDGEKITLYHGDQELTTVTNTIKDMGGFDEDAVWIGEQLTYDISGNDLYVQAVLGVKFVVGKVLHYEDMPTISARVTLNNDGSFTLSELKIEN